LQSVYTNLDTKRIKNGKEQLPDWHAEEAFAQCWRISIAQNGSNVTLQQKPQLVFLKNSQFHKSVSHWFFAVIDSLFSYLCYVCYGAF